MGKRERGCRTTFLNRFRNGFRKHAAGYMALPELRLLSELAGYWRAYFNNPFESESACQLGPACGSFSS